MTLSDGRAGIRLGDRLTSIGGVPFADRGCGGVLGQYSRPLGFERDGEYFEVTIEPAVLVP